MCPQIVPKTTFEVLFEDEVVSFATAEEKLQLAGNETLLSLTNGYEDGQWRYEGFSRFIWDHVQDTALTQREREAYVGEPMSILQQAAKRLRLCDDRGKGSEIAEIFLYGIMRRYYEALPAVPKIFHKQNRNDNAKGADSVHIIVTENGSFELWLGEAKFYKHISRSLFEKIIDSVENTLDKVAVRKENSLLLGMPDVQECLQKKYPEQAQLLFAKIQSVLHQDTSMDEIKRILHIPILLIDECQITKDNKFLDEQCRYDIKEFHKRRTIEFFSQQSLRLKMKVPLYSEIKFHLILFPIPDKEMIVDNFLNKAQSFREEGTP